MTTEADAIDARHAEASNRCDVEGMRNAARDLQALRNRVRALTDAARGAGAFSAFSVEELGTLLSYVQGKLDAASVRRARNCAQDDGQPSSAPTGQGTTGTMPQEAAQPAPDLRQLQIESIRVNSAHSEASRRCDRATMEQLQGRLDALARQARAAADAAAGSAQAADADRIARSVQARADDARTREPRNCGERPEGQPAGTAGATPGTSAVPSPPRGTIGERAAMLVEQARAAARRCDRAGLEAAIGQLQALLAEAEENDLRFSGTPDQDRAIGDLLNVQDRLREAQRLQPSNCGEPQSSRPRFEIIGGYRQYLVPRLGLGFSGEQQEQPATQSDGKVGAFEFGGSLELPFGNWRPRFRFSYGEGDASNAADFPATGQDQFGGVYTAPSPSGTSGVQLQPLGMQTRSQIALRDFSARVDFSLATASLGRDEIDVFAYAGFDRLERTHSGTIAASASFFGNDFFFNQSRVQKLDENRFGAGLVADYRLPFSPFVSLGFRAALGGYHRRSELVSIEQVQSNVVPAQDRDFTIEIRDSDSGFGVEGSVGAALEFLLSPGMSVFVGGSTGHVSNVGAVFNPSSSRELLDESLRTGIETDDVSWWRIGAGVRFWFGGR